MTDQVHLWSVILIICMEIGRWPTVISSSVSKRDRRQQDAQAKKAKRDSESVQEREDRRQAAQSKKLKCM